MLVKLAFEEEIYQGVFDMMDCPPVDKTSEKYKEAVLKAIKKAKKSVKCIKMTVSILIGKYISEH